MSRQSHSWIGQDLLESNKLLLQGSIAGGAATLLALALAIRPICGIGLLAAGLIILLTARHLFGSLILILSVVVLLGADSLLSINVGFQLVEVDALLLIAMFGATIHALTHSSGLRLRTMDSPVLLFAWAMVIAVIVGLLNGSPPDTIRNELRSIGFLIGTYLIARQSLTDVKQVRSLMIIILIATVLASLRTVFVYVTEPLAHVANPASNPGIGGEGFSLGNRVMNSNGFKRVITAGGELYPVIAFIGVTAFLGTVKTSFQRIILGLSLLVLLAVIVISFTRSYWMGAFAGLALYAVAPPSRQGRWVWGLLLLLVVLAVVSVGHIGAMQGIDALGLLGDRIMFWRNIGGDDSAQARISEFQAILSIVRENPILGRGLGGGFVYYSPFGGGTYLTSGYTHNSYMSVLLKSGLLGLFALLNLLAAGGRNAWFLLRRVESAELRQLAFVYSACLVVVSAVSLTAPWLTHYVGTALLGVSLAALMFLREQATAGGDAGDERCAAGDAAEPGMVAGPLTSAGSGATGTDRTLSIG